MNDKFRFLWSLPGHSSVTVTKEELQNFLLDTGGRVMANGQRHEVKSEYIGANIYKVVLCLKEGGE